MEFINLQVYMLCLAIRSRWCRSTFDTFSTKPRHKKGENAESLRAVLSNFQLSSFGREKMKFLKLSKMIGLDK